MTTRTPTPATSATVPDPTADGATVVDTFLHAVTSGTGIPVEIYAPGATLDATVPGWRLSAEGGDAIAAQYRSWFADPAAFEELERSPLPDGEAVVYLLTWTEEGVPHAGHHCHLFRLDDDGLIASDTVFCGGRWSATLLAEMGAAS